MPVTSHLSQCAYCGGAVFRLNLHSGPAGLTDIDWQPWTIEDEVPPTHEPLNKTALKRWEEEHPGKEPPVYDENKPVSKTTLKRWADERPYRLGLVVIDLRTGTYQAATDKPRGHLRSSVMHKLHMCQEKERQLYGIGKTSTNTRANRRPSHQ
jgi:hypothetical protein